MLNFENLNVMTDIRGATRFFIPAPNERNEYDIPKARRQTSAFLHRTRHILTGWFLFNLPKAACLMPPQDTLSRPWMAESLNYSFSGFRMGRTTCHKSYFYNKDVQCLNWWYKINLKDSVPKYQKWGFASSVSFPQHDVYAILCHSKWLVRSSSTGLLVDLPSPIIVFPEWDFVTFAGAAGEQPSISPTSDSILPNIGPVEPPPQPVLSGMQLLYNALYILALPYLFKPATYWYRPWIPGFPKLVPNYHPV